jgi:hypothetical protein
MVHHDRSHGTLDRYPGAQVAVFAGQEFGSAQGFQLWRRAGHRFSRESRLLQQVDNGLLASLELVDFFLEGDYPFLKRLNFLTKFLVFRA